MNIMLKIGDEVDHAAAERRDPGGDHAQFRADAAARLGAARVASGR